MDVFRENEDESLDDDLNAKMDAQEAVIKAAEQKLAKTPMLTPEAFAASGWGSRPFEDDEALMQKDAKAPRKTNADKLLDALIDGSHKCGHDLRIETGIKSYAALGRAASALRKKGYQVRKIRWNAPSSDMYHIIDATPELREERLAWEREQRAGAPDASRIERKAALSVDPLTPGDEASLAPVGDDPDWMD